MTVRLEVVHAGPHVTIQDGGRPGRMRFGVPRSGPMDRLAHAAANLAIGVDAASTAVEVSPGGLTLRCAGGDMSVGVAGGGFRNSWEVHSLRDGDELGVWAGEWGSWAYVSVLGDLVAPRWLGHTATHSMSGFGGGAVGTGHVIDVDRARVDPARHGAIPMPELARPLDSVRVVLGPQHRHFTDAAIEAFTSERYVLSAAYDRMGVRLDGPELPPQGALSIPSEPILRGSVQVGGDGVATVLLADHQTTGGYPKIATVISCDIDRFSQLRTGESVRFVPVTPAEAIGATRDHAAEVAAYLDSISTPGRTLAQRLMLENLIAGAAAEPFD